MTTLILSTGVNLLDGDYFELNDRGFPLHASEVAEKVKNFSLDKDIIRINTQSEVVLNGFRIRQITESFAFICFHYWNKEKYVIKIKNGIIDNWVEGFFDQQEKDLSNLFKLQR